MFQFANPAVLWALTGLALPVLLHLVHRRPALRWRFPSLRFIAPAPLPRKGTRRLHDPLLLLLRLLFYAGAIMMVARPQWIPPAAAAGADSGEHILLIDASASMSGWGAWQEAQDIAHNIIRENPNVPIGLVIVADDVLASVSPTMDHPPLLESISGSVPAPFRGQPTIGLDVAVGLFSAAPRFLHVISDFQRTDWEETNWPILDNVSVTFYPVGVDRSGNRVIVSAQSYAREDDLLDVIAQLRNDDSQPAEVQVTLEAGEMLYEQTVSVDAGETVPFAFTLDRPGDAHGILKMVTDSYPMDNAYHLYLGPPPPIRVVSVLPLAPSNRTAEEAFFLRTVLEAQTGAENLRFEMDTIPASLISETILGMIDAIHISPESAGSGDVPWEILREFCTRGGLVHVSLGEGAARIVRDLREAGLSDIRHVGRTVRPMVRYSPFRIGEISTTSRLADVFTGEAARDLYLGDLYEYVRLEASMLETVLLQSEDGDPLMLERPVGNGTFILSAFPWNTGASDIPLRNAFLPLIHEVFKGALPSGGGLMREEARSTVTPDLLTIGATVADLAEPGLVEALDRPLLVNVSRMESEPTTISMESLQHRADFAGASTGAESEQAHARLLWHWFALAIVMIFVLESLLGGWLDRRNSVGPQSDSSE